MRCPCTHIQDHLIHRFYIGLNLYLPIFILKFIEKVDLSKEECKASSEYNTDYLCEKAFNGKIGLLQDWSPVSAKGVGAWISITMPDKKPISISKVQLANRMIKGQYVFHFVLVMKTRKNGNDYM